MKRDTFLLFAFISFCSTFLFIMNIYFTHKETQQFKLMQTEIQQEISTLKQTQNSIRSLNNNTEKLQNGVDNLKKFLSEYHDKVESIIKTSNPHLSNTTANLESRIFIQTSYKYRIPLHILLAIGYQESRFTPNAINSDSNCMGIMQINKAIWAKNYSDSKVLDPNFNIQMGAFILRHYYDQTKNWNLAIIKYYGLDSFGKTIYKKQVLSHARKIRYVLSE